jgi:hypothetical protein
LYLWIWEANTSGERVHVGLVIAKTTRVPQKTKPVREIGVSLFACGVETSALVKFVVSDAIEYD